MDFVVQEKILLEYFKVSDSDKFRKGVFYRKPWLINTDLHYGDPLYSLVSYFQFFHSNTEPINTDFEEYDATDWLQYAEIDVHSTRMRLDNDYVLVEARVFPKMLYLYMSEIADDELRTTMEEMGTSIPISVKTIRKIVSLYNSTNKGIPNKKTVKVRSSRCSNGTHKNKKTGICEPI